MKTLCKENVSPQRVKNKCGCFGIRLIFVASYSASAASEDHGLTMARILGNKSRREIRINVNVLRVYSLKLKVFMLLHPRVNVYIKIVVAGKGLAYLHV